jgi:hypothetical protein
MRGAAWATWIGLHLGIFRPCRGHPSSDIVRLHCLFERGRRHVDDQMTNSPIPLPGSEFNDFLFAPIGEDRNGMLVSVLSGLARSDVDPWQEAARLAKLPGDTATQRLASLIGSALPDRVASYPESRTIAARLVELLPRPLGSRGTSGSAWAAMNSRPWWIYVVFMAFVLGSQFLIASHQLPVKPDDANAKAASTVPPAPPQVGAGQ